MPALRELQNMFAEAILSDDMKAVSAWMVDGPIAYADRMRIHRNTMLGALAGALRLAYPAVDALVGSDFFDQAARDLARDYPPKAPLLTLYGAEFSEFLTGYEAASSLPYLPDVARLEWAIELTGRAPDWDEAPPRAEIDLAAIRLVLAPSLTLLKTDYPAEPIWRAVLDKNETAMAAIDPGPAPSTLAVWRQADGAAVAVLAPASATFLESLIAGTDAATALASAATLAEGGDLIAAITTEILSAGFVRLTPLP